ncbi:MAG: DUF4292 domain-containing protein [Desulfobacterales bacterium]|nr:DUF4292 domain-containing protein [Desulfobacterales bacterium]
MKFVYQSFRCLCIFLAVNVFLFACSSLKTPSKPPAGVLRPKALPDPEQLISVLKNKNSAIKTFKGLGRVKLKNEGALQTARMAWSGAHSGKLRIEVLGASGQPLASLADDGQWVSVVLHTRARYYKKRSGSSDLERLVSVPMDSGGAIALLTGRVPVAAHRTAMVAEDGDGYVLYLKKRWWGGSEKIYFDKNQKDVSRFEVYDPEDKLMYRVVFEGVRNVQGFQLPGRLVIADEKEILFQLDMDRYWINVPVSSSLFVLTPPG